MATEKIQESRSARDGFPLTLLSAIVPTQTQPTRTMKLTLSVYRTADLGIDCSNGAPSATCDRIIVIGERDAYDPEDPSFTSWPDRPVYRLGRVEFCGQVSVHLRLVKEWENRFCRERFAGERGCGPMCGGNYASTSDGRLARAVEEMTGNPFFGALPIHDRYETASEYEVLSR